MAHIGFVGLGQMGAPMAARLVEAGHDVWVYNRTADKAEPLVKKGASAVETPRDAAGVKDRVIVTMVADDAALEEVTLGEDGLIEGLGEGGVHISMSTVSPDCARRLARAHEEKGSTYIAAPVFGRPEAAAAGRLFVVMSGRPDARECAKPMVAPFSQRVFEVGDEVERAHVAKLAGNFLLASAIEAMSEAFALGERWGLDRAQLADLYGSTLFSCPVYQSYGKAIAEQRHPAGGFALRLGLKDVELARAAAREKVVPMPLASLLYDRLLTSVAKGRGDLDLSALGVLASEDTGAAGGE